MKCTIFWNVAPYILVEVEVIFYQISWHHILDHTTIRSHRHEIPKSSNDDDDDDYEYE
jgi:hypothetical protein